jgi:hypothetical protein
MKAMRDIKKRAVAFSTALALALTVAACDADPDDGDTGDTGDVGVTTTFNTGTTMDPGTGTTLAP